MAEIESNFEISRFDSNGNLHTSLWTVIEDLGSDLVTSRITALSTDVLRCSLISGDGVVDSSGVFNELQPGDELVFCKDSVERLQKSNASRAE